MTPKSLLRLEECVSTPAQLSSGAFEEILDDPAVNEKGEKERKKITRVIFCSGKVYYDLNNHRKTKNIDNVAVVRIEQLYPFHADMYAEILKSYKNAKSWVWCQEEPRNMGAWSYVRDCLQEQLKEKLCYAGRPASAAPAVGATATHKKEQTKLIEEAFKV